MTDEHRAHAALQRSLSALAVGNPKERERADAELATLRPGNMVQVVTVPVSGSASAAPASAVISITFDHPFLSPLSPDENDLTTPAFSSGAELQSVGEVIVHTQVVDWTYDDSGLIVGARVKAISYAPGTDPMAFSGKFHLSFSGYASPTDDDDDDAPPVAIDGGAPTSFS